MVGEAQQKPAVFLLVILPLMVGGGVGLMIALVDVYSRVAGVAKSAVPNLNGLLIALPAFFIWIPVSLLISNFVICFVPPLRRIAEAYVSRIEGPGFGACQKMLLKQLGLVAVICLPLIILGFTL